MGWTSYHAEHYKNGSVDRKAECDAYFMEGLNRGHFEVLKSSMVGRVYYAAVKTLLRGVKKNGSDEYVYEPIPEDEQEVWGAIMLTSVDMKDWFNFSYKTMDETCGPCYNDCPKGILDLLSPTDSQWANDWRKACYENIAKKKDPNSLNNLPWGSIIEWTTQYDLNSGRKAGEKIKLVKAAIGGNNIKSKAYWTDGYYRISTRLIGNDYVVIKKGGKK